MRPHLLSVCDCLRSKPWLDRLPQRERLLNKRLLPFLVQPQQVKAAILSLSVLVVTGCSTLSSALPGNQAAQATKPQTAKLNTASLLAQASPSPQASQPITFDRQNQLSTLGYNEGNEAGRRALPSNSRNGIDFYKLTDLTEQKIYTDAYDRGYADGKGTVPPTNTVSPTRRAELQQKGKENGTNDGQPGANVAANPGNGITVLGLTDETEIKIYTDAYNTAYQQASRPKPITVPRLNQLKQQAYNEGYADAQSNLPQDPNRSTTYLGLVNVTEQRAYTNSYNAGYQKYLALIQPLPVNGAW